MTKTACVLMTALVPTVGHAALIEFAYNLVWPTNGRVFVIVSGLSKEPIELYQRIDALRQHFQFLPNIFIIAHADDKAPQNPASDAEWEYWRSLVMSYTSKLDYFVASEPYGKKMAMITGSQFMPFDIDRRILSVKGTNVRQRIVDNYENILPEFKPNLQMKFTLFGQESTGKTTMMNAISRRNPDWFTGIHEFARPYLENQTNAETVTTEHMNAITVGQFALQTTAYYHAKTPFFIQDTDLLSTIGYYGIYGSELNENIIDYFDMTKSDLYFVMPDTVPFEPDPLRYGGTERESTKQYWIDLLEKHDCRYYVIPEGVHTVRAVENEILSEIYDAINLKYSEIGLYERD